VAVKGTITQNADGTVRFTAVCMLCEQPCAVDRLDPEKLAAWQAGGYVQDLFPERSAAEREALVSGSHAECFGQAFADDDEDPDDDFEDIPGAQDASWAAYWDGTSKFRDGE
jgi:hypothetical protein